MTELVYYSDAYRKTIKAHVLEIRGNALVLDRTIFYPECGGQPGDKGYFGPYRILDTQKGDDDVPLHIVEDSSIFSPGDEYELSLDWEHRYKYMKEHSAQHLLSALLFHEFGIGTLSVHQGEELLTIETDKESIDEELLLSLEDKANAVIREGRAIWQSEMSHEEAESLKMRRSIKVDGRVKVVFIENLDAVACGGVHVKSTSEIEEIVFRGVEHIRSHVRTIWSVSDTAKAFRRDNAKVLDIASTLLSSQRDNIPSAIERLQKEVYSLQKALSDMEKCLAEEELTKHLFDSNQKSIIFTTMLSLDAFQGIVSQYDKEILILQKGEKKGFMYYGTKERFMMLKELGLKGGGKSELFRGTYLVDCADLLKKAESILAK